MHALAVTEQGTTVHAEGDCLLIRRGETVFKRVRIGELDQVLLFGRVELSSGAVAVLARKGIDVVYLTQHGTFRARLVTHGSNNVELRLTQMRRAGDPQFAAGIARSIVLGKVKHQRQVLLRAQRRLRDPNVAQVLGRMRVIVEQLPRETDVDRLRGIEGQAAALYFSVFGRLIRTGDFVFTHRNRRPPRDPVNATLSFGYALLTNMAESEVARCGLDPMIGFFHQPAYGRPSLVLDVIEEFRPLIDDLMLRMINRRQLGVIDFQRRPTQPLETMLAAPVIPQPAAPIATSTESQEEDDPPPFDVEGAADDAPRPAVYLAETGRKIVLTAFFQRLRERTYYPPREASYEWRQILREQVYHLARVVQAKEPQYIAFVPK